MIITINKGKNFYASVEYDEKDKTLKLKEETDQSIIDGLADRLTQEFWVYDPRGGKSSNMTRKPKDKFQTYLCLEQALQGTDTKIKYEPIG